MNIFKRIAARVHCGLFGTPEDELRYSLIDAEMDGDLAGAEYCAHQLEQYKRQHQGSAFSSSGGTPVLQVREEPRR